MTAWHIGKKELAIIHIAAQQLNLSEAEYRKTLKEVGVTTSKDLTYPQYNKLLWQLQADGFVLVSREKTYNKPPSAAWDKGPLLKKIGAILADMDLKWNYADGIAKRMFRVDSTSWCTPEQLHSIVAALEYKRRKVAV